MADLPTLVCVDPARVKEIWPHVVPLIDRAHERFGSKDERREVEKDVFSGMALLWIAWSKEKNIEAALVTDLVAEDDYLVCRLRALSGRRLYRWIRLLSKIEDYARNEKCRFVRYVGRRGWALMLGDEYKVTHVRAEKALR